MVIMLSIHPNKIEDKIIEILDNHFVQSSCGKTHDAKDLNCKLGAEFDHCFNILNKLIYFQIKF